MDNLEKYFKENRNLFDDAEPSDGHFARFEAKLQMMDQQQERRISRVNWIRVAAIAVILLATGLISYEFVSGRFKGGNDNEFASLNVPDDVREAYQYYDQSSARKMNEISKISQSCPEGAKLLDKANREISLFDANSVELVRAIRENPGDERIQAAFIQNQKMKEATLSNLVLEGNMNHCK
jgi:hypothetical protein